jgi:phospholipid transport system substrate-binding protein
MLAPLMAAALAASLAAGPATDLLQARDAELRAALPPAGVAASPEVQGRLEKILGASFDLPGMVAAAMDARWATLTPRQRQRLLDAFGGKLRHAAAAGLGDFRSSTVDYQPEVARPGGLVLVPTRLTSRGETAAVTYTLRRSQAGWRIVDITVDGVSTVENYRASFARIIAKEGVDGLLKRLERPEAPAAASGPPP